MRALVLLFVVVGMFLTTPAIADIKIRHVVKEFTYKKLFGNKTKDYTVVYWTAENTGAEADFTGFEYALMRGNAQVRSGMHPLVAHQFCEVHSCPGNTLIVGSGYITQKVFPGAIIRGVSVFEGHGGRLIFDD